MVQSPSISADTEEDFFLKFELLDDLMTIIDMEEKLTGKEEHIGGFDLVYAVRDSVNMHSLILNVHDIM